jgi:ADP-ribosylglycohydrolase
MTKYTPEHFKACLIGGAIGDALGAPIEFDTLKSIIQKYGESGVQNYVEYRNGTGEFTDDTQMTLFTAEGLLRACHRSVLRGIESDLNGIMYMSYLRWLQTQGYKNSRNLEFNDGWLINRKELFKLRAPGNTCLSALTGETVGKLDKPINDSKGCGTIMRVAPIGLFFNDNNEKAFKVACEASAITHSHPTGYLSAGFFASVISDLTKGIRLLEAVDNAKLILKNWQKHEETLEAVDKCLNLYELNKHNSTHLFETTEKLGGGWVAEEALSISLYCSLIHENDFRNGVILSINHSGDCDSTGSITGNILGLINGMSSIPGEWITNLKYKDIVLDTAADLFIKFKGNTYEPDENWWGRYPGY